MSTGTLHRVILNWPTAGTERGRAMVEESLRRFGAGRSILVDRVQPADRRSSDCARRRTPPSRVGRNRRGHSPRLLMEAMPAVRALDVVRQFIEPMRRMPGWLSLRQHHRPPR
jgi:hypothetical protein